MTTNESLLPCPFCASVPTQRHLARSFGHKIECDGCGAETDSYKYAEDAADAWNRRAPPSAQQEPVAIYAGVDMSRYTIEWLIEPDTTGMKPFEKLRTLAYKERVPVGTKFYTRPIAAQPAEPAKDGWRMVPVEPTMAMLEAVDGVGLHDSRMVARGMAVNAYSAMLAAAPQPEEGHE